MVEVGQKAPAIFNNLEIVVFNYCSSQKYRPLFHFTPIKGWLNDPNGLIQFDNEYHLFYQHDPDNLVSRRDNKHWGHAVSNDLIRWKHLPIAIFPDKTGSAWSGSTVVDFNNCSGFQIGDKKTIIAFYTSRTASQQMQSIAFSNNRGLTWAKYKGNPIIKIDAPPIPNFRDPRVFWHEKTKKWIMIIYLCKPEDRRGFAFYSSDNLLDWQMNSWLEGFFECPDLFEMPVDGKVTNKKWVIIDAKNYAIGNFDGRSFQLEGDILKIDHGMNFYATQTWDDIANSRRVQIAWMRGGVYPEMPFNQQLSFPCSLSLQSFGGVVRLCRNPIEEIKQFYADESSFENVTVNIANNLLKDIYGEVFDITVEFNVFNNNDFGIIVRGEKIVFRQTSNTVSFLGSQALLEPENNTIKLRLLVDRTSIELFGNNGKISMSSCFLPCNENKHVSVFSKKDIANKTVSVCAQQTSKQLIKKMEVYILSFA